MGQGDGTGGGTLSIRRMAVALGMSKSEVHRDAQAGMPMTSVDAAREWRRQHEDLSRTREGRIDRPELFGRPDTSPKGVVSPPSASSQDLGPEQLRPVAASDGAGHTSAPADDAPGASPQEGDDAPQPGDTAEYRRARAERERTRADKEALELERLRGKLIDVDEAGRLAFTAFRGLRDAFENMAPRLKDQLAAESDPFKVEQVLQAEIAAVLASFDVEAAVREKDDEDED
jgi:hypothetical protein